MNGYKKLWYGGYGKYNYYVVAGDKDEALEALRDKYNMRALPVDCKEINNIDGHIIIPVLESELEGLDDITIDEGEKKPIVSIESEMKEHYGESLLKENIPAEELNNGESETSIEALSRNELLQLAKQLDVDGKIATFKTEELREKVGEKLGATEKESGASN